jgi:hypothetical protein
VSALTQLKSWEEWSDGTYGIKIHFALSPSGRTGHDE